MGCSGMPWGRLHHRIQPGERFFTVSPLRVALNANIWDDLGRHGTPWEQWGCSGST
jgi:hypothetical protein